MSRGQARLRSQTTRRVLERCQNSGNIEDAIIIDDDTEADVVLIDNPNTSHQGSKNVKTTSLKCSPRGVIYIDDEEEDHINSSSDTASNKFAKRFSSLSLSEDSDSSDGSLMFARNGRHCCDHTGPSCSRNHYGLDLDSESSMDDSESSMDESTSVKSNLVDCDEFEGSSSDCEIMEDHSGIIREQWEEAASRKKEGCQVASSDQATTACGSTVYPEDPLHAPILHNADVGNFFERMPSNHFKELLAEFSLRSSKRAEQRPPVNIFSTNENEDFCFKTSVNISITKSAPNSHIPHKESGNWRKDEESSSEECPQKTHSKTDGPNFLNKDAQESVKASFFTYESHSKTMFSDKEEPSTRTSCASPTWDGKQMSKDDVICPDGVEEKLGEVSYNAQSKHEMVVEREAADVKESEKGDWEESSPFSSRQHEEPLINAQSSTICGNMDAKRNNKVDETSDVGLTSHKLDDRPHIYGGLIGERERHKETDEYRRAAEEEWASRQRQLQIQAEEAQRMRKRRKAENIRLLDMEKRQKLRLEEIRNMQKKVEETTQLKEHIRTEVRKDLERVEMKCWDMASVLRALGIHVKGGLVPMVHEVNAAYKQALLRFHPDRASRTDIRQQVEAEEKFKLISRLKETLLP